MVVYVRISMPKSEYDLADNANERILELAVDQIAMSNKSPRRQKTAAVDTPHHPRLHQRLSG